jgi:redox-sensing transcriptional repressor
LAKGATQHTMKKRKVSNAVIRRLPRYYQTLDHLHKEGHVRISSSALGNYMGVTASQIRQDLSCFGEFGQQGYGYTIPDLRKEISEILGMTKGYRAVLLGAGNLGRALIKNFPFHDSGFELLTAFDTDPDIIGTAINGIPVLPLSELDSFVVEHEISVGILTVPMHAAHDLAQRLVTAGVKGIWNFTNTEIDIQSPHVAVESIHFADSLLTLSYLISNPTPDK